VDVSRGRNRQGLAATFLVALGLAGSTIGAADPGQPAIEKLITQAAGADLVVEVVTSGPPPRYTCQLSTGGSRDVFVELPGVASHLQPRYTLQSPLVQEILVQPREGGGIVIRFRVTAGVLSGLERTDGSLRLRFGQGAASAGEPRDYRVGVGDKLEISVFGHEDLTKTVEVRGDGKIEFPLIGDVEVAGKPVSQIGDEITKLLGRDYLVDPQVSVDVKEYQSQWVTVLGEVRTPGRYALKRDMRLIDALAEAGGATKEAGSEIVISRRGSPDADAHPIVVDRDDLFGTQGAGADLVLKHGDIVTVREKAVFYIRGEVTRPGSYFLENDMTIMKSISIAGGLTQFANRRQVELIRAEEGSRQRKQVVNLKAIEEGKIADIPLRQNDIVIIPRRIF
jgi:polysaccharide export outer membrane protein